MPLIFAVVGILAWVVHIQEQKKLEYWKCRYDDEYPQITNAEFEMKLYQDFYDKGNNLDDAVDLGQEALIKKYHFIPCIPRDKVRIVDGTVCCNGGRPTKYDGDIIKERKSIYNCMRGEMIDPGKNTIENFVYNSEFIPAPKRTWKSSFFTNYKTVGRIVYSPDYGDVQVIKNIFDGDGMPYAILAKILDPNKRDGYKKVIILSRNLKYVEKR